MRKLSSWVATATLFALVAPAQAGTSYTLTDLGDLPGGINRSDPHGINATGQVVGQSVATTGFRAYLWQSGVGMTDLGDIPGGIDGSYAFGINSAGQVVGYSDGIGGPRAYLWKSGVGLTDLGSLGGSGFNIAYGINDSGQVVGRSGAATGDRAFLWQAGVGMIDLGDLPGGGDRSYAYGLNSGGQVVGYSDATTGERAFLWQSGIGLTDLGDLPGGSNRSQAYGVNDNGQVVGFSGVATGEHGFLWQSGVGMIDLGDVPGGGDFSNAWGINANGHVVGQSQNAFGYTAYIWQSGTGMRDLNPLLNASGDGWTVFDAQGINDAGWIVGSARHYSGVIHSVLLTPSDAAPALPVPLPSATLMALVGLAGLAVIAGLRRRERGPGVVGVAIPRWVLCALACSTAAAARADTVLLGALSHEGFSGPQVSPGLSFLPSLRIQVDQPLGSALLYSIGDLGAGLGMGTYAQAEFTLDVSNSSGFSGFASHVTDGGLNNLVQVARLTGTGAFTGFFGFGQDLQILPSLYSDELVFVKATFFDLEWLPNGLQQSLAWSASTFEFWGTEGPLPTFPLPPEPPPTVPPTVPAPSASLSTLALLAGWVVVARLRTRRPDTLG